MGFGTGGGTTPTIHYFNGYIQGSGAGGKLQVGDKTLVAMPFACTLKAGTFGGALLSVAVGAGYSVTVRLTKVLAAFSA